MLRFDATCPGSFREPNDPFVPDGRGTLRLKLDPPAMDREAPELLLKLDGGRGTKRPAGAGEFIEPALVSGARAAGFSKVRPAFEFSGPRAAGVFTLRPAVSPPRVAGEAASPRAVGEPKLREAGEPKFPCDVAGGVIRLTVGREKALADGRTPAVARPPTIASRVGVAFTRDNDVTPRI